MENKHTNKLILGITLLFFTLGLFNMHKGHEWGDDFSLYLSQSDALVNGTVHDLYEQNRRMMELSERPMGPFLYPFGFPAFLSPLARIAPGELLFFKIWNWLFASIAVFFLLKLMVHLNPKNGKTVLAGFFVLSIFILHPKFVERSDHLLSDVFFCSLCFLFFYSLYVVKTGGLRSVLLVLLMVVAAETRSNGIFLLAAYLVHYAFEQNSFADLFRKKTITNFNGPWVLTLLTVFSLVLIKSVLPAGSENHWAYLSRISAAQLGSNAAYYFKLIGEFPLYYIVKMSGYGLIGKTLVTLSWILIVTGLILQRKQHTALLFWFLMNIGLYILWPFVQGVRFILPVAPLIVWYFMAGLQHLVFRLNSESKLIRFIPAAMIVLIVQAAAVTVYNYRRDTNKAFTEDALALYDFCAKSIPGDEVVSFFKPRLLHYASARISIFTETDSFYRRSEARYRVIEHAAKHLQPADYEEAVYKNNSFIVFKRKE